MRKCGVRIFKKHTGVKTQVQSSSKDTLTNAYLATGKINLLLLTHLLSVHVLRAASSTGSLAR
jgi:hypothetical protein